MIEKLVEMYQIGAITADHLVLQCLHMVDPQHPDRVLEGLPTTALSGMLKYAHEYQPGQIANYGLQPVEDQVNAAKRWIECNAGIAARRLNNGAYFFRRVYFIHRPSVSKATPGESNYTLVRRRRQNRLTGTVRDAKKILHAVDSSDHPTCSGRAILA